MNERRVRRDSWGFGVPCEQPGCYEIGLEPDGKCERHGFRVDKRRSMATSMADKPPERGKAQDHSF